MNRSRVQNISRALTAAFLLSGSVLCAQEASEKRTDDAGAATGVYEVGNGVTAPKATYMPTAEFSEKARKKRIQGTVILSVVVTPEGNVRDLRVIKSLERTLDQQAIAAVSKWKFEPATKDGKPVAVHLSTDVSFRLY